MDYKRHLLIGVIISGIFLYLNFYKNYFNFSLIESSFLVVLMLLFSLLPDIDSFSSYVRTFLIVAGFLAVGLTIYLGYKILSYFLISIMIFIALQRHRGNLHSLKFAFIFASPFYFYFGLIGASFLASAYVLHLLLDNEIKL